ncbi:MAG TPA: hypothetical protein VHB78_04635 [Vicinamibacterales bacterium]|jgi:hypothetical protein|nr:hypothetical protein [Vicinamibacterales bacterium]
MSHAAIIVAIVLVAAVAYAGAPRERTLLLVAFITAVAGGIALFASPTPGGYAPELSEHRFGGAVWAYYGPILSAALFAAATTALVCASGMRRRSSQEREPDETGHPA